MAPQEKELLILESIYARPRPIHQRDIAEIAGLSPGMTNAILSTGRERKHSSSDSGRSET